MLPHLTSRQPVIPCYSGLFILTARWIARDDEEDSEMNDRTTLSLAWRACRPVVTAMAVLAVSLSRCAGSGSCAGTTAPGAEGGSETRRQASAATGAGRCGSRTGGPAAAGAGRSTPPLIYSPWAKFCNKAPDPNAKQVCFTGRDARTETGVPVVAAALIEPDGEPKKIFRITLPSPLQLQYGSRIIVDQNQPITSPFFTCFANGCMADYEGTPDLITKLKKGKQLQVQAININGSQISFPVPLTEFAKANEGAPSDPKKYEEEQAKLQAELQKRAEEQRKKLEAQGQAPAASQR